MKLKYKQKNQLQLKRFYGIFTFVSGMIFERY